MADRKVPMNAFVQTIEVLLRTGSRKATKYVAPDLVVKATRKSYGGKPARKDSRSETLLVTFGKPNFLERKFIAAAIAAGEPFPIKRVQLRGFPGRS